MVNRNSIKTKNLMFKKYMLTALFICVILFMVFNIIASEIDLRIKKDGTIEGVAPSGSGDPAGEAKINYDVYTRLAEKHEIIRKNIENIAHYAFKNFPAGEQGKGTIKIDLETRVIAIITPNGEIFAKIPISYSSTYGVEKNDKDFVLVKQADYAMMDTIGDYDKRVKEKTNYGLSSELELNGIQIELKERSAKVSYTKNEKGEKGIIVEGEGIVDGSYYSVYTDKNSKFSLFGDGENRVFTLKGKGDIVFGSDYDRSGLSSTRSSSIKDAVMKLDKNHEVIFVEFDSLGEQFYSFEYKDKNYNFQAKKGAHILFDPLNGKISGKEVILDVGDISISASKEFSLLIDENGNFKEVQFAEGDRVYMNGYEYLSSEGKGALKVFFDGRDIKNLDGNFVSIEEGGKAKLKGFVKVDKGGGLTYEGLSKDTYTEFEPVKKEEPGQSFPFFDVQKGDATIENLNHKIIMENGEAKLVKGDGQQNSLSFGFRHYDKNGVKIEGFLDGNVDGKYTLVAYRADGKSLVLEIDFSKLKEESSDLMLFSKKIKDELDNAQATAMLKGINEEIVNLKEKIAKAGSDEEKKKLSLEMDKLLLKKILTESRINTVMNRPDAVTDAVKKLETYLEAERGREFKIAAQSMLAEMLSRTAKSGMSNVFELSIKGGDTVYASNQYGIQVPNPKDTSIKFSFDETGKVKSYFIGDKEYSTTDATWKIHINDEYEPEIQEFLGSSGSISDLQRIAQGNDAVYGLTNTAGASVDEFKKSLEVSDKVRKLYGTMMSSLETNEEKAMASLGIAGTYRIFGDYEKSRQEYTNIAGDSEDNKIRAEAYRLAAATGLAGGFTKNAVDAFDLLEKAVAEDPTNEQAKKNLAEFRTSMLDLRAGLWFKESQKTLDDFEKLFGESTGSDFADHVMSGLRPVTDFYARIKGQDWVNKLKESFSTSSEMHIGVSTISDIASSGYDPALFMKKSTAEKFGILSGIYGYDKKITQEQFQSYLREANIDFSGNGKYGEIENYDTKVRQLFSIIAEKKGEIAAAEFNNEFNRVMLRLTYLEVATRLDPVANKLATDGQGKYTYLGGDRSDLITAFTEDRAGKPIEMDAFTSVSLKVGDFVAGALAMGGIGKILGGAASESGLGGVFGVTRAVLNPGEALALKAIGDVRYTTALLGMGGDVAAGTAMSTAAYALDARFGAIVDIVSFGVSGGAGKSVKGVLEGVFKNADGSFVSEVRFSGEKELSEFLSSNRLKQVEGEMGLYVGEKGERVVAYIGKDIPPNSVTGDLSSKMTLEEFNKWAYEATEITGETGAEQQGRYAGLGTSPETAFERQNKDALTRVAELRKSGGDSQAEIARILDEEMQLPDSAFDSISKTRLAALDALYDEIQYDKAMRERLGDLDNSEIVSRIRSVVQNYAERLYLAEKIAGRPLTDLEKKAILAAHYTAPLESSYLGSGLNYRPKVDYLSAGGLMDQADMFMRTGLVGDGTSVAGGCFLADTKIRMADGFYKSIQNIFIGERVAAYDIFNKKPEEAEVTMVFARPETRYRIIEYEIIG